MTSLKINLPDSAGNIISLEVVRQTRLEQQLKKQCAHNSVYIDPSLANIKCNDCGQELNPMGWLAMLAEEWHRVTRLYDGYKEAKQALDGRSRTKCRHCGKFTSIR
jgi:ribosomal protein S27E